MRGTAVANARRSRGRTAWPWAPLVVGLRLRFWLGLWICVALSWPVAAAPPKDDGKALPGVRDDPSGKLPPPPDADDGGEDTEGADPELTEQQQFELRQRIFDEHLRKAQAAQRKDRHHEALREYSAAPLT